MPFAYVPTSRRRRGRSGVPAVLRVSATVNVPGVTRASAAAFVESIHDLQLWVAPNQLGASTVAVTRASTATYQEDI